MERSHNEFRLGDFFVVSTEWDNWCVSTEMARHIDKTLDADPLPRWITFVDLTGARVRLRADSIESLTQRSAQQRALTRLYERLAKEERSADRMLEEDQG
jgi:hypothetical protein